MLGLSSGQMTPWVSVSFAKSWFSDARYEARTDGRDARRREILFAAACAESFLLEWTRDVALNHDMSRVSEFFPPDDRAGIEQRWKRVTKALAVGRLIAAIPDFRRSAAWREFVSLVDMRNGLVHANVSRPLTPG